VKQAATLCLQRVIPQYRGEASVKAILTKSLGIQLVLVSLMFAGLSASCWFGVCELMKRWIDLSSGTGLVMLIAFVVITTAALVLSIVRQKVVLPVRLIEKYNRSQLIDCTAEDCAVMLIPEERIPSGRIGELMRSRNMMLKHLERTLRERQENYRKIKGLEKIKDDLTHMIIHDLKSPLGMILMTFDLLHGKGHLPARHQKLVESALRSGKDMSRMIQNLLDIGKMEEGKLGLHPRTLAIDRFMESMLTGVREGNLLEGRSLRFVNRSPGVQLTIDVDMMQRVFTNLIGNAVKHTPPNGSIEVRLEREADRDEARILVVDNGRGIAKEYHQKIFEKFEQINIKDQAAGSGLGLTFCKLAVEAHGGRIWVESEPGNGSTFHVELPLALVR
jgi:signal transduction histidine kinase